MEGKEYNEFVRAAMQGILAGHGPYDMPPADVAKKAIEIADAVTEAIINKKLKCNN